MLYKEEFRRVFYRDSTIEYLLQRKPVKNINLRIHADSRIVVSADTSVPAKTIDRFVIKKGAYILASSRQFKEITEFDPPPNQYISGESFYILGRSVRLKVQKGVEDQVTCDGVYLYLTVTDINNHTKKQKLVDAFLDRRCHKVFNEILEEIYPVFAKYGVTKPSIQIRRMKIRWGTCSPANKTITLNKQLLETPRHCIEYVVLHELCHFIHPNHSKQFYNFVTMLMPDWKERKVQLDKTALYAL